jgi:hypothetical protein
MPQARNDLADRLEALAGRVVHNGLRRLDPERFHAEKSDIAAELRTLARAQRGDTRRRASTTWRAGD